MGTDESSIQRRTVLKVLGGTVGLTGVAVGHTSAADIICVDPDDDACEDTIQDAIHKADPGVEIKVSEGTYQPDDPVFIYKSLTLTGDPGGNEPGAGDAAPIIDGEGDERDGFIIQPDTSDVSIRGFEIRDLSFNQGGGDGVVGRGKTEDIKITDNTISDVGFNGVHAASRGEDVHGSWTVVRNAIDGAAGFGINLTNATDSRVSNNEVRGAESVSNPFKDESARSVGGMSIQGRIGPWANVDDDHALEMESVEITDNEVSGPFKDVGMVVIAERSSGGTVEVRDVTIEDNTVFGGPTGILLGGRGNDEGRGTTMGGITIQGNAVSDTKMGIRWFRYENPLYEDFKIADNKITDNERIGVLVTSNVEAEQIAVSANNILDNKQGGVLIAPDADASTVTVHENNITGNEEFGAVNLGAGTLEAQQNWWGAKNGPKRQAGNSDQEVGDGDRVSDDIQFKPWLSHEK